MFPVIIQNKEVIFDRCPMKPNKTRSEIPMSSWFTDYGMVIPVDHSSIGVKAWLDKGRIDIPSGLAARAILLDTDGALNVITILREDKGLPLVEVSYVDIATDVKYVRASKVELEEHVTALFSLNYSNEKIVKHLTDHTLLGGPSVETHNLGVLYGALLLKTKKPKTFHSSVFYRNEV